MKITTRLVLGAAAVALTAMPASAAVDFIKAQAGLDAMSKLNAIVLGNMGMTSDVEGKLFVGGLLGGSGTVASGASNGQGFVASSFASLTVGGNLGASSVNVLNGIGLPAVQVQIGGNAIGLGVNAASSLTKVGGSFNNSGFNPTANKKVSYGTTASNVQAQDQAFVTKDASLAVGGANDLKASIAATTASFSDNFANLSAALAGLSLASNPSSITMGGQGPTFNVVKGNNAFALFNINANLLSSAEINFNVSGSAYPIIINVTGTNVNWTANSIGGFNESLNRSIIWNFIDATSVNLQRIVHGSVLARNAAVTNNTPIEGSLVAKSFTQGGEVHLGTFGYTVPFAVPEPASWTMMIAGFALAGAAMRRRNPLGLRAA
ncbi:choice-of-anchor A family protein [Sphingomonas sp. ID1715]|uniref:collagen-binding domain-containing protein n=1 Tax=Sphingomonas sp. ID1715 TaxID=1656898 RepID=UPI0014896DD1|nr:collagen-binding domain-containing protein [Sphingomonas sp. ID1715]NNM76294.1 choice-of-anchor A family protein [Sphingomonas sp. ID1715]